MLRFTENRNTPRNPWQHCTHSHGMATQLRYGTRTYNSTSNRTSSSCGRRNFAANRVPCHAPDRKSLSDSWCRMAGLPNAIALLATLPHLIATALFFLLITMVAHLFAVWSNQRMFRDQIDAPFKFLIFAIWPSVVWLPLLVLLIRGHSIWTVLVPPLIACSAAFTLKRWSLASRDSTTTPRDAGAISTLFHIQNPPSLLRVIAPAIITSIAFQAAATELALGNLLTAGSLLAVCTVFPIWTYPIKLPPFVLNQNTASSVRSAVPRTLTVFLFIAIALLPYSISNNHTPATPKKAAGSLAHGDSYSGVILCSASKTPSRDRGPTSTHIDTIQQPSKQARNYSLRWRVLVLQATRSTSQGRRAHRSRRPYKKEHPLHRHPTALHGSSPASGYPHKDELLPRHPSGHSKCRQPARCDLCRNSPERHSFKDHTIFARTCNSFERRSEHLTQPSAHQRDSQLPLSHSQSSATIRRDNSGN